MGKTDKETTVHELKKLVKQFRDERDWSKHHTPKNLAMSIAIEAAELMEHFQWDDYTLQDKQKVTDELGDVLIYCFNFADTLDIDVASAFREKLAKAAKKYPVEIFNGQDRPEDYQRIKQEYRKGRK